MPRRSSKRSGFGPDPTVRIHGNYRATLSVAAGVSALSLSPLLLDQRLVDLSDSYSEFRFVRAKLRAWNSDVATDIAIAYTPTFLATAPTFAQMTSLPMFSTGNGQFGSPNPHLDVRRAELTANAPKWYRRGTAFDDLLEVQGNFYTAQLINFATRTATIHLEYEIELRANADVGLTSRAPAKAGASAMGAMAATLSMTPRPDSKESEDDLVLVPRSSLRKVSAGS